MLDRDEDSTVEVDVEVLATRDFGPDEYIGGWSYSG